MKATRDPDHDPQGFGRQNRFDGAAISQKKRNRRRRIDLDLRRGILKRVGDVAGPSV
jgi:hypothetical protein